MLHRHVATFVARRWSSFASCAVTSPALLASLSRLNITTPTHTQVAALPHVCAGKDVILTAETGSGKSLAYALPIAQRVLALTDAAGAGDTPSAFAMIVVPTQELVQQTVHLFHQLLPPRLHGLIHGIHGPRGLPSQTPSLIIVGTPTAIQSNVHTQHVLAVRVLVLDEADSLLSGTYSKSVKGHILATVAQHPHESRPQHVFVAATMPAGGKKSPSAFLDAYCAGREVLRVQTDRVHKPATHVQQAFVQIDAHVPLTLAERETAARRAAPPVGASVAEGSAVEDSIAVEMNARAVEDRLAEMRDSDAAYAASVSALRVHAVIQCLLNTDARAFHIVAEAQDDIVTRVTRDHARSELALGMAPSAAASAGLVAPFGASAAPHQPPEILVMSKPAELLSKVPIVPADAARVPPTLIFVSSVDAVDTMRKSLSDAFGPALRIAALHKRVSDEQREARMKAFMSGDTRVLVCTDVAARGVDTIQVEHVIQAEFAQDAVTYLHRIGRTGRAGRPGRVTSLLCRMNLPLAQTIVDRLRQDAVVSGAALVRTSTPTEANS